MELVIKSDTLRVADLISDLLHMRIKNMLCGMSDQRAALFKPVYTTIYCGYYSFMLQPDDPVPNPYTVATITVDEANESFQLAVCTAGLLEHVTAIVPADKISDWMKEVTIPDLLKVAGNRNALRDKIYWTNFKMEEIDLAAGIVFNLFYRIFATVGQDNQPEE